MDYTNEVLPVASSSRATEEEHSETPSPGGRRPECHDLTTSGDVTATPSTTPAGSSSLSSTLPTDAGPGGPSTPSNVSPELYAAETPPAGTATSSNAGPAPQVDSIPDPATMANHGLAAPNAHFVESHAIDDQFHQDDPENDEVASDNFYTDDEQPSVPASTSVSVSASAPAPPPPPPSSDHAEGPPTRSPISTRVQTPPRSPSPPQDHHDLSDFDSPAQGKTLPLYQATISSSSVAGAGANRDSSTEPKETRDAEVDVAHVTADDPKGMGTGRERCDEEEEEDVLDVREPHHQLTPPPRGPSPPQCTSQDGLSGPSSKHPHANADGTVDLDAWMYDLDEQTWDEVHGIKGPSYEEDEALARAIAMESEWNELEVMAYGGRPSEMHGEERNVARARDSGANIDARREAVRTEWDVEIDEDMEIAMAVAAIDCAERERLTREQEELEERLLVEAETRADDDYNADLEDDGTFVECGCCFSTYPLERMTVCSDAHLFCRSCLRRYATTELGSQNHELRCMHTSGCDAPFPESELRRVLPVKLFSLYERLKQQKELKEAALEGLEVCPFCDWGCVLEASKEEYPIFLCGNWECAKSSCRLCRKKTHAQRTCLEVEEDRHIGGRLAIEEAMTEAMKRRCPTCLIEFIKSDGCNKITCRSCRTLSCYVCRQAIDGYNHFYRNDPSIPGSSSASDKCPLWDEDDNRHDQEAREAYERVLEEYRRDNPEVEVGRNLRMNVPSSSKT